MTAVQVRPSEPTAGYREPTTVVVELDDGLTDDDWLVDSPTAGLAEVARLDRTGRPGYRRLVVDLRKSKDAPDPGEHRLTVLIRRNEVLHTTVDIPLRIVEKRRCLAIAGAVPKFIVNADGSVTLRLTIFNRCGASASLDLRANVGRKGIDIHAPAVSIGPGEFGIIDPKLTMDTGDFADLVTRGQLPDDFGLSISTKGSVGGEIRLTAKDFVEKLHAPPPPPDPPPTPGPSRSSTFAKVGAAAVGVAGLVGLIWVGSQLLSDPDEGASDVTTTVVPTSTGAPIDTEALNETDAAEEPVCFWVPSNGVAFNGEEPEASPDDPDCHGLKPDELWMTPSECWDAYVEWFDWAANADVPWEVRFPESPCGRDPLPLPG